MPTSTDEIKLHIDAGSAPQGMPTDIAFRKVQQNIHKTRKKNKNSVKSTFSSRSLSENSVFQKNWIFKPLINKGLNLAKSLILLFSDSLLGGCPRTEAVARESWFEADFFII
ncbi:hypothetical protein QUF61_02985 [Candidatus Venteria ishoeyi]|uniref:hypothetical protein n=1 Tax=Candidatus Venteria ishoeyi TaxID=1899563 RepID=UPI0025A50A64|nr:hypothetical protein [Candidatus Venteria ishoeyi]MDM8545437.1 hypothetical protein [Candidatus Venteria ishoeyi]